MCHKESDCSEDKCCAMIAMTKSHTGFCMPAKQLGDRCAPTFIVSPFILFSSVPFCLFLSLISLHMLVSQWAKKQSVGVYF